MPFAGALAVLLVGQGGATLEVPSLLQLLVLNMADVDYQVVLWLLQFASAQPGRVGLAGHRLQTLKEFWHVWHFCWLLV